MEIEFYWSKDPKRRFRLKDGLIMMGRPTELRELTNYSPLQPVPKSDPSMPPKSILLSFARIDSDAAALAFVNEFGPVTGFLAKGEPVKAIRKEAQGMAALLDAATDEPPEQFAEHLIEYQIDYGFGQMALEVSQGSGGATISLRIPNLLGALKYMLARKIEAGTIFKRCQYAECTTPIFDVGKGANRTIKADFCCTKHQIQHNNDLRKAKG